MKQNGDANVVGEEALLIEILEIIFCIPRRIRWYTVQIKRSPHKASAHSVVIQSDHFLILPTCVLRFIAYFVIVSRLLNLSDKRGQHVLSWMLTFLGNGF